MKKIKVRFNLGRGERYMKWKIQYPDKRVDYLDPNSVQLIMNGCTLHNNTDLAKNIFKGGHKVVCSWIICESIKVSKKAVIDKNRKRISYNPRIAPNWIYRKRNVDGCEYNVLFTSNRGVYKV